MSARFQTRKHTLDGTWEVLNSIFTALDDDMDIGAIGLRASKSNAGDVFWADSDESEGGFLSPGDAAGLELNQKFVYVRDFFLKGTVGDVLFITWLAP